MVDLGKGRPFAHRRRVPREPAEPGNRLFPTQVLITPTSVVQYTPRWIGQQEETIHMAHVASVKIDTGMLLSDVLIETSGGSDPIRCHGHRKGDAVRMKELIERYQTDYYRSRAEGTATRRRASRSCRVVAAENRGHSLPQVHGRSADNPR